MARRKTSTPKGGKSAAMSSTKVAAYCEQTPQLGAFARPTGGVDRNNSAKARLMMSQAPALHLTAPLVPHLPP